jgi:hypothetical protein
MGIGGGGGEERGGRPVSQLVVLRFAVVPADSELVVGGVRARFAVAPANLVLAVVIDMLESEIPKDAKEENSIKKKH